VHYCPEAIDGQVGACLLLGTGQRLRCGYVYSTPETPLPAIPQIASNRHSAILNLQFIYQEFGESSGSMTRRQPV
jgi:hypothetical protein